MASNQAFQPVGAGLTSTLPFTSLINVTTSAQAAQLSTGAQMTVRFTAVGSAPVYCTFGSSNVVATIATTSAAGGLALPAAAGGAVEKLNISPGGWMSCLSTAAGTALYYTPGSGGV